MSARRVVSMILPAVSGSSRNLVRGIVDYAAEQGDWHLVLHLWGKVSQQNLASVFQGDGLLFEEVLSSSEMELPAVLPIPAVGMQNDSLVSSAPVVANDHAALGHMAGEYLVEKGLTHLGYVSYMQGNRTEAGFRDAAAQRGIPVESYYLHGDQPELDAAARMRLMEWFQSLPAPTGVLFREDFLAYKVMDWLPREWIPERLGVMGIGNDPLICEITHPTLTSVDRDALAIGRRAAELLHRMMDGEAVKKKVHRLPPGHVVERQSTGLEYTPDPLITRAIQIMKTRMEHPPGVEELCRELHSSRRTLERRCKQAMGRTVWQQQRHLQISKAKDLLLYSEKTLAYISDVCGFRSPQQFSKGFREAVGDTPRGYRRKGASPKIVS